MGETQREVGAPDREKHKSGGNGECLSTGEIERKGKKRTKSKKKKGKMGGK